MSVGGAIICALPARQAAGASPSSRMPSALSPFADGVGTNSSVTQNHFGTFRLLLSFFAVLSYKNEVQINASSAIVPEHSMGVLVMTMDLVKSTEVPPRKLDGISKS